MDRSHSRPGPDESSFNIPAHFVQHVALAEHVALLEDPGRFDQLRRKDNLLADGVAAVFGLAGAEAELVGLCFQAGNFTAAEAEKWLADQGFLPVLFISAGAAVHG
jgi:hypothetical protein